MKRPIAGPPNPRPKTKPLQADNHIRVTLDFVPVANRVPADRRMVFIAPAPAMSKFPFHVGIYAIGIEDGDQWLTWHASGIWRRAREEALTVTHWCEIPTIENKEG